MKINNRVWLVIVPVIILAYVGMCTLVYQTQKQSYLKLEQSRLESQLDRLRDNFLHDHALALQFASALLESPALHKVLLQDSNELSTHATQRNLNKRIATLTSPSLTDYEVVALDRRNEQKYFYSDSTDPFLGVSSELTSFIKTDQAKRNFKSSELINRENQYSLLLAFTLDPLTMKLPAGERWSNAVVLGFRMNLANMNKVIMQLLTSGEYNIARSSGIAPVTLHQDITGSISLSPDQSLRLTRDPADINALLLTLTLRLALVVIALSLFTSLLLGTLIQRFITAPVVALEASLRGLEEFIPGDRNKHQDEVRSLGATIQELNSQRTAALQKIKVLAETDSLTQLHNRRMFSDCVESIINRSKEGDHIALFYIDLDNFKFVNDNYGHEIGDQVLKEFAAQLKSVLRVTDLVMSVNQNISRLGGDEFAVIVTDCDWESGYPSIAGRILDIFENSFQSSVGNFPISASIGIALFPQDGHDATSLIASADAAMYQAKELGKNQFSFYSQELADKTRRQQLIEANLKMKDFKDFFMNYMPLFDAATGDIRGVEALLRWNSPELGMVSPAEFIPIAESRGLFLDLDLWVINKVIDDLPHIIQALGPTCKVAINISSAQLGCENFFYELMSVVTRRNVDRRNLELEITETFGAEMSARVIASLNLFKQAGFSLALDDFGAGYTSLLQLMKYPVDVIKIDKSLIDHVLTEGSDLVKGLVAFCRQQGLSVTAEGIEQAEQAEVLRIAGVHTFQGFYFAKPQSLMDLVDACSLRMNNL